MSASSQPDSVDTTLAGDRSAPRIVEGQRVGRYTVLRRIGGGGMGIVYLAYDPELDRKLALKVLRPPRRRSRSLDRHRARLVREAQVLARLSHPNVVEVHDVGLHEDSVFVAMEYVEGLTLTRWLSHTARSWREILTVLAGAGRGLQAAHDAGVVHRDFKPDNVMVDRSNVARVLDFGLARTRDSTSGTDTSPSELGSNVVSISLSSPLTRAGALIGTPAYMAAEQFAGGDCDARADQFGFCVTAWRALYGNRPFEADDATALSAAVRAGKIRDPPSDRRVPRHIERALRRGLSPRREDRFASMSELLAELARDPWGRVRRGAVLTGFAGAAVLASTFVGAPPRACEDGRARLAPMWNDDIREEIGDRFGRVPEFGEAAWSRVDEGIDAWADDWVDAYHDACATARGETAHPAAELDLRMRCLDEQRRTVQALVGVLREADTATVVASRDAIAELPATESCADVEALEARIRPPEDPATARAVTAVRDTHARVNALATAGQTVPALHQIRPLLTRAESIGYEPLLAEIEAATGRLEATVGDHDRAVELLDSAYFRARTHGHDAVARDAAVSLVEIDGTDRHDLEAAERWAAHARAELARTPSALAELRLEVKISGAYREAGRYDDAVPHAQRAVELSRSADVARTHALLALAGALFDQGRRDEARPLYEEVLTLSERLYGSSHPKTARAALNLASALAVWGESEAARDPARRAVAVWRRSRPGSDDLVGGLMTLGLIESRLSQHDDALATLREALAIVEQSHGPRDQLAAKLHGNIGLALGGSGDAKGAAEHFARARDIFEEVHDADHPLVGMAEANLGMAHADLGELDTAVAHYERGLEILEAAFGTDDPRLRDPLESLATIERMREHPDRAAHWDARLAALRPR